MHIHGKSITEMTSEELSELRDNVSLMEYLNQLRYEFPQVIERNLKIIENRKE